MKNTHRAIVNGLFAPAILAAILITETAVHRNGSAGPGLYQLYFVGVCFVAGIPSMAHAAIMETLYRRGFDPADLRTTGLSTLSGGILGFLILNIMVTTLHGETVHSSWLLPALGAVVGATTGLLILAFSRLNRDSA